LQQLVSASALAASVLEFELAQEAQVRAPQS
jgi:hypothetical protein